MPKPLPEWFERAKAMKVHEVIVVEVEVLPAKQRVILNNLAKMPGKFKTRRIEGTGYKIERVG